MQGDEVRVIAPSLSLKLVSQDNISNAIQTLESLDLKITFGEHVYEEDIFHSSSIQSRISDLHRAVRKNHQKC